MITRILISKKLIAEFRKRAIAAYPQEHMETCWGRIEGSSVIIEALHTPHQHATTDTVRYQESDALAKAGSGLAYIGSCHSHPDSTDATPSQVDWDTSFSSGEHVFGVMRVAKKENGKFTTEIGWWESRPGIAMIHPRVRNVRVLQDRFEDKEVVGTGESVSRVTEVSRTSSGDSKRVVSQEGEQ